MRNIDDSIWRDEWFASQEIMGRLLWIGIVSRVADDQGRFLDNAELIKSDVFPMDKIDADEIDNWLTWYATSGKVVRYVAGGKRLMQVTNWWRYQSASSWMARSKYLPPNGWQDYWRCHAKGRTIDQSVNWALRSGLPSGLDTPLQAQEGEVKGEVKGEEEGKGKQAPQNRAASYSLDSGYAESNRVLLSASQLAALPSNEIARLDGVYAMIAAHGKDKVIEALTEARMGWTKTPKKQGGGFYSVLNFGWVDWANEFLSTGVKRWQQSSASVAPAITHRAPPMRD